MRFTVVLKSLLLGFLLFIAILTYFRAPSNSTSRISKLSSTWLTGLGTQHASHHNSTAHAQRFAFWSVWAEYISLAKPNTRSVHVAFPASNEPAPEDPLANRTVTSSYTRLLERDVDALKKAHAKYCAYLANLDSEDTSNPAQLLYNGTGVVVVAGGEYFGPAMIGIKMLRQSGSKLPVEVFLANWAEYEEVICEKVLADLGAKCIVLEDYLQPEMGSVHRDRKAQFDIKHYQTKALALLLSSFQHALFLDSDSIVLVDPEKELFNCHPYRQYGFVGWPDFWASTEDPRFYKIAGLGEDGFKGLPAASSEAGQMLVDKSRHLKTLLLAAYYNAWGPDYFYPLLSQGALGQGDKETFMMAAHVLGQPFYRVRTKVKSIGRRNKGKYKGTAMIQWHPGDDYHNLYHKNSRSKRQVDQPLGTVSEVVRAVFAHSNTPKMNAGHLVDEGDLQDIVTGDHLRLWGSLEQQQDIFGEDLERRVWEHLLDDGCAYAAILKDWSKRKSMCKRLRTHWDAVFKDEV